MTDEIPGLITRDGFALVLDAVDAATVSALITALEDAADVPSARRRGGVYAIRNLLEAVPAVAALAVSPQMRALTIPVLGPDVFPVRGILFDKTPGANWNVLWHQDLSIAVRERRDVPGFGPWSEKAGVVHVQPPPAVMERMLTVRLHLDDCEVANGPLLVLPAHTRVGG